jgi:hypothetical protein
VDLAFTYYGGHRRYDAWDPLDVRRIPVERDVTAEVFRAMARWPALVGAPRGEPWSARVGETLRGWTGR